MGQGSRRYSPVNRPRSRDPRSGKELHACAFFVEGATKHIVTAVGGGPLNALIRRASPYGEFSRIQMAASEHSPE
jgi:hypothetical protein